MIIDNDIKLDFSDVLIRPKRSTLNSRNEINLEREFTFTHSKQYWKGIPIIASNMDTVGTIEMFKTLSKNKILTCLYKYIDIQKVVKVCIAKEADPNFMILSTGITDQNWIHLCESVALLSNNNIKLKFICIDVANGYMARLVTFCNKVRRKFPNITLIAGNVVTREVVEELIINGKVDIVKVGIGQGCHRGNTRILMANGTYKNISKIEIGEEVINKDGNPVKVINKINTGKKSVARLRTNNWHDDTIVTLNHSYWIGDLSTSSEKSLKKTGKAKLLDKLAKTKPKSSKYKWKSLDEIKYDNKVTLLMPNNIDWNLPENISIDLADYCERATTCENNLTLGNSECVRYISSCYDLGYIFGTFLGNGHTCTKTNNSTCHWSFGIHENNIAEKLVNCIKNILDFDSITRERGNNLIQVYCYNKFLGNLLNQFGKRTEKHLPSKYFCKNKDYIKGIYDGLINSNGSRENCRIKGNIICSLINTSKYILEVFYWCCMNLGISFSAMEKPKSIGNLKGTKLKNLKQGYRINTHTFNRVTKNYIYSEIFEKELLDKEEEVWDIEVDCPTHSFIANNSIVHNSVCTTRLQTGVGMPQLSAILECADAAHGVGGCIIADGGIKVPGDLSKAFGGGADFVMCGSMFAGHTESAGKIINEGDKQYKLFYGMSSHTAMNKYHGGVAKYRSSEGKTVKIPYRGDVQHTINSMLGGIRSTCTYIGACRLKDLPKCTTFMRVTNQVNNIYSGKNYKQ